MKVLLAILAGSVATLCLTADQAPSPEGMTCRMVTVVRVHPGPNWDQFPQYVPKHLEALREGMKSGEILYAGPLENGDGGISIYAGTDLEKIDQLLQKDPTIANKVCTYSMFVWRMCEPKQK